MQLSARGKANNLLKMIAEAGKIIISSEKIIVSPWAERPLQNQEVITQKEAPGVLFM